MTRRPRISVICCTARDDYPYAGRYLHCLAPVAASMADQTFTDLELIVVDAHWEKRGDWFANEHVPFPVKHVPASPNAWLDRGMSGRCAQFNRGLAWADGELVWRATDRDLFHPRFFETLWRLWEKQLVGVAWYVTEEDPAAVNSPIRSWYAQHAVAPRSYNMLGYYGQSVSVDHRYARFAEDPEREVTSCSHEHYYGYSAIPLELALRVNGLNEAFDGDSYLNDVDLGSRIDLAGYGGRLAMHRDLFVVELPVLHHWHGAPASKCNYALYLWHRRMGLYRANEPYSPSPLANLRRLICPTCAGEPQCERRPRVADPEDPVVQFWLAHLPDMDLQAERSRRKRGDPPYDRAHVHGAAA